MTTQSSVRQLHSSQMLMIDAARQEAERAGAFLLKSLVLTVMRSCRADLTTTQRERFCHRALSMHRRGLTLVQRPSVSQCFSVDLDLLRDRSIGIARFQMRKQFSAAREIARQAITDAIVPTYPATRQRTDTATQQRRTALPASTPLAA